MRSDASAVPVVIELTKREEAFVRALVVHGLRPSPAAEMAGYAPSSSSHLLKKDHLREAIRAVYDNAAVLVGRFDKQETAGAK
jgi:hypothetical protein